MQRYKLFFLFLLMQGGMVMAYELASSRLLTPVYGTSSWIWTYILGMTMTGLAYGYKFGSSQCRKRDITKEISLDISIAVSFCTFIACIFPLLENYLYLFSFFLSLFFSSLLVLFIPMTFLGAITPLSIEFHQTINKSMAGISGGNIFFTSTIGGVIFLFLFNLIMLPTFGIFISIWIYSFGILIITWLLFKKHKIMLLALSIILISFFLHTVLKDILTNERIVFQSENHYGNLKVVLSEKGKYQVYVNGILQSENSEFKKQLNYYDTILNLIPNIPSKILIIGMGGGTLARLLQKKNHDVTAVEINPDMIYIAKHFFLLPADIKVFNSDGRIFVRKNHRSLKFNYVVLDAFNGEIQPYHLFTIEHFSMLKKMLTDTIGKILINWHGYITGSEGYGTHVLINTLSACGFETRIHATPGTEDYRNLILECTLKKKFNTSLHNEIYSDERTFGEWNNALAHLRWRMNYFRYKAFFEKY